MSTVCSADADADARAASFATRAHSITNLAYLTSLKYGTHVMFELLLHLLYVF